VTIIFYQTTTGTLQAIGLTDGGNFANNATLSATLYYPNGEAVSEFSNVSGTYVPGSNGDYNFTVPSLNLPAGGGYSCIVQGSTPDGKSRTWQLNVIVAVGS